MLVHIGYQKSATKWLRDSLFRNEAAGFGWLTQHDPPIWGIVHSDPFEFDAAAARRDLEPTVAKIEAASLEPVISWGRLAGTAFSGGYDGGLLADRLAAMFPDARIAVVIREQRSMLVATYKQYVKTGGVAPLDAFLEPGEWQGKIPAFRYEFFEYHRLVGYYQSLFGRDSVLAMPYEQLVADRGGFLKRVAEFGGRPLSDDVLKRILKARSRNIGQSALMISATRPLNRFAPASELNPVPHRGPRRVAALAARARKRVDPSDVPALRGLADWSERRLREDVAKAVGDRYAASNRETAAMIGVDLADYGWTV